MTSSRGNQCKAENCEEAVILLNNCWRKTVYFAFIQMKHYNVKKILKEQENTVIN